MYDLLKKYNSADVPPPSVFAPQVRAARGLLKWTQGYLAQKSGIMRKTIADIENEHSAPYLTTMNRIYRVLRRAGVEFIPENGGGPGVKLTKRRKG